MVAVYGININSIMDLAIVKVIEQLSTIYEKLKGLKPEIYISDIFGDEKNSFKSLLLSANF